MMADDLPQATIVMMAVEQGDHLLEIGAAKEALENFKTAVKLNSDLISELLSDNEAIAKLAARRRPPPPMDLVTYATSPLMHLYRLMRQQGEPRAAFQWAQIVLSLFARLAPNSAGTADFLDELADIARQIADNEYAQMCSEQARRIRELLTFGGV